MILGFNALAQTVSSEVDQYIESHFPHFSSHRLTQLSPTHNDGSPILSWMTAFTCPQRWRFVSGKPCSADWINSFTITSLSASVSQDSLALNSRRHFRPLMHAWSVVFDTLKRRATSRTDKVVLIVSGSWYAVKASWSDAFFWV